MAVTALLVSSCNVIDITKKRYSNGYHVSTSWGKNANEKSALPTEKKTTEETNTTDIAVENNSTTEVVTPSEKVNEPVSSPVMSATKTTRTKRNTLNKTSEVATNNTLFTQKSSKMNIAKIQLKEKKVLNSVAYDSTNADGVTLLLLFILAILLPPLAVFIKKRLGLAFWVSLILTLLFWVPGVIFAILVVFDVI